MRVIAGKARSLPLKTVASNNIRPTTDKTKETLFNILMPYLNGCRFLDLYAGSGAIGIEALSRGAFCVVFVEKDRQAQKCIEENLRFTKLEEGASLLKMDVSSALRKLSREMAFDVIFMDPPYSKELEKQTLTELSESPLLTDDTLVVVEAANGTDLSYVDDLGLQIVREKIYKTNRHIFIKRK